jgi:ankyrin repeat protein
MEHLFYNRRSVVFGRAVMFALVSALLPAQSVADRPEVVEMEGFRVTAPPEGKWKIARDEAGEIVTFTKFREGVLAQMAGQVRGSAITVMKIRLEPAAWRLTEDQAAEWIMKGYIREQARDFDAPGTLTDKGEIVLKDRKVRFLMFRTDFRPGSEGSGQKGDLALFLYFPPRFEKFHVFFGFTYWFVRPGGGPVKLYRHPGLEPVHAVIESLEVHDPLEAVPGKGGDLIRAAAAGDVEAVRFLVDQGVSAETCAPLWTPLIAASFFGRKEVIDLLLEQGAAIDQPEEREGATPLVAAIVAGEPEVAAYLVERGADVNHRMKEGSGPLLIAAMQGDAGLTAKLLEKGPPVDGATAHGETPLMFAVDCGSVETARILVAAGADINAQTHSGDTPLMFAAGRGHTETALWLLENGARCDHQCRNGETPLWRAIENEDLALARTLIEAGARVDARAEGGFTAIMMAAEYGLTDIVKLLIEAGADVNARSDQKATALKLAKLKKNAEIVALLKAAGAK